MINSKVLFIGDSQTLYLSDSPDAHIYWKHINKTRTEPFLSGTIGKYYNSKYNAHFSWKLGQSAYSLTEETLKQLAHISDERVTVISLFGTVDMRHGLVKYNNPEEVAIKYCSTLNIFFGDKIEYYTGAPISNEGIDEHFETFNEVLGSLIGNRHIAYPDTVLRRNFISSDYLNHITFEDADRVVKFLLNKVNEVND